MTDLKKELHEKLQIGRATILAKLEGLNEYDMRRPMTPTGTNLLGLAKHLAGVEYGYFGRTFGRPPPEKMSWYEDGSVWDGADMWATVDESSEYVVGLYRRACAHGDKTINKLDLDTPGSVPHWPADRRLTTLGVLMVRMVNETAQHAGHADIVREMIDGNAGNDANFPDDEDWPKYVAEVQRAAEAFRTTPWPPPMRRWSDR